VQHYPHDRPIRLGLDPSGTVRQSLDEQSQVFPVALLDLDAAFEHREPVALQEGLTAPWRGSRDGRVQIHWSNTREAAKSCPATSTRPVVDHDDAEL
jgi:hypothetical protein